MRSPTYATCSPYNRNKIDTLNLNSIQATTRPGLNTALRYPHVNPCNQVFPATFKLCIIAGGASDSTLAVADALALAAVAVALCDEGKAGNHTRNTIRLADAANTRCSLRCLRRLTSRSGPARRRCPPRCPLGYLACFLAHIVRDPPRSRMRNLKQLGQVRALLLHAGNVDTATAHVTSRWAWSGISVKTRSVRKETDFSVECAPQNPLRFTLPCSKRALSPSLLALSRWCVVEL